VFGEHDNIPYWSHLRAKHSHLVNRNCFLNELRLEKYERKFKKNWPDCEFEYVSNGERALAELHSIRKLGELEEFSDKELMTDALITVWKKT
jgi:hypothetical protein